jgi:hypothetical protein
MRMGVDNHSLPWLADEKYPSASFPSFLVIAVS